MSALTESDLLSYVPTGLFIAGTWRPASDGARVAVEDPSTGKVLAHVADATPTDGLDALAAAADAQQEWAATAPRTRGEILRSAFEALTARVEEFALLMTLEMGKPLAQARGEVAYGAEFFRWFSEEAVRVAGRWSIAPDGGSRLLTMKQPVGPTLMITPWNFPLAMGTRKIGPALAAGCTMVLKPATQTPLTMLLLADLLENAGVPAGVVNVITTSRTSEVVEPIMADPRLRKVTFTGSTPVGRTLVKQSAQQLLRVSMELGGNAPFLVFDDADVDAAVEGAMLAKMRNMGQACTAANRFLVQDNVIEEFADKFAAKLSALPLGRGTEGGVEVGPLIDAKARDSVEALVQDAKDRGAQVVCGGSTTGEKGYFYAPTLLTGVPVSARVMQEETFGPVAPLASFSTEEEAIDAANATAYGLAAYVYTRDLARMMRVSERLDVGMIGANQGLVSNAAAPFGGVKHSGFGREGGAEGIEEYLEVKYIGMTT